MHSNASDLAAVLDVDLASAGWDGTLVPYPGMHHTQYAMMALHHSLLKKLHNKQVSDERDARAFAKFESVNKACAEYRPANFADNLIAIAIGEAKDFIHSFTHRFSSELGADESLLGFYKIEPHFGFGKGANIGARSGDPYGKLAISRLTYTNPTLLVLFQHSCSMRKLWTEQEQFRSMNYPSSQVQGSKLSFVPKSSEITRTICTEPILNMFVQKGIAHVLEGRLREVVGIDLSTQPDKNRVLAHRGSVSGEFGTIDLSNASDSMSMTLVREWFPPAFVYWLELSRSPTTELKGGRVMDLHMVSSMGNAYTFPLQTLFFTALVLGAYRALDIPIQKPRRAAVGNFAVFGDDIIVRREAYNLVVRMLHHCGFTVNESKSFNEGPFRESCGSDFYYGHNVRGVYITKLLDDQDCYSAYNRLSYWSTRHMVPLYRTLSYLQKGVTKRLYVPLHEDDEAGFKAPLSAVKHFLRQYRKFGCNFTFSYLRAARRRCFVKLPKDESEVTPKLLRKLRKKVPQWRYSPPGLLLLLLHGNIRDGRILLRDDGGSAEYLKAHSSCWDYVPSARSERPGFADDLKRVCSLVLYDEVTRP